HPPRRANITVPADSHLAEVAVHVQANRTTDPSGHSHPHLHSSNCQSGRTSGTTTQTDTSSQAQSRQVAGAAERKARARSPSIKTAYPSAFSREGPCPGSAEPTARTGRTLRRAVSCLEERFGVFHRVRTA